MDVTWIASSVSLIGAVISGLFAFVVSRNNAKSQIELLERQRKEDQYFDFIGELVRFKSTGGNNGDKLGSLAQQIYLVGDVNVVNATNELINYLKTDSPSKQEQDRLYSALLQAMRRSLYGGCSNGGFPEKVELTVFQ